MDACTRVQLRRSFGKLCNSQPQTERVQPVAPPCISVCEMDEARGLYIGCIRMIDEIVSRSTMNDAARLAMRKTLPERACAWLNDAPCA